MAIVKRSSIVLIRYPFTDLSGYKVRPAVIVMSDDLLKKSDDVLCIFISSVLEQNNLASDFVLLQNNPLFKKSGLKVNSVIRAHKIALLHKTLILRVLGELDLSLMIELDNRMKLALGIK